MFKRSKFKLNNFFSGNKYFFLKRRKRVHGIYTTVSLVGFFTCFNYFKFCSYNEKQQQNYNNNKNQKVWCGWQITIFSWRATWCLNEKGSKSIESTL